MAFGADQTLKAPRLLLSGASSQIGVFVIPKLLKAGFRIFAVSRKGKPPNWPGFEQVQWMKVPEAMKAAADCQFLLSAGPMELAQEFLSTGTQLQSAIIFSSSSVTSKAASGNPREKDQIAAMLASESALCQLAEQRKIKLTIFKPTLIYGCGLDTNISRLASWICRYGFMPVNGKASGLRQPVHAEDLAAAAVAAICSEKELPLDLFLAGGETLTYGDMVKRIFKSMEKKPRLVHLPQWMFVLLIKLYSVAKKAEGVNAEMVRRQLVDLVFDDHQARELLGFDPRPFNPGESDFSLPEFDELT